jgi:hypothetical protein
MGLADIFFSLSFSQIFTLLEFGIGEDSVAA